MLCRGGQATEEDMYNNGTSDDLIGPVFSTVVPRKFKVSVITGLGCDSGQ